LLALRNDLGSALLPVVAGLIATDAGWTYGDRIRDATSQVAGQLGRMEVVETDDLSMFSDDPLHYDADGNLQLGWRFAEAVAGLQRTLRWRFPADFGGIQGDGCWSYRAHSPSGAPTQLSFVVASARWTSNEAGVAIGDGWMQPGTSSSVELTWWAPFSGRIDVSLKAAMAGPGEVGASLGVLDATGRRCAHSVSSIRPRSGTP
jgi:hypothetical protein